MLSKVSINTESNYFFAGNPWSCNCQNIKTIQEFLEKYSSLIMDTEHMHCAGGESTLLHLDYKEICSKGHDYMIWVIVVEAIRLVMIMIKLTWDCVRVQTHRTPTLGSKTLVLECARHLKREMDAPIIQHVCPGRTSYWAGKWCGP